ncbi:MAG: hypothetical protein R3B48_11895 [Kofleriaceae bacterium]
MLTADAPVTRLPLSGRPRRARAARAERGNALLISLIALTGLATLGNLTVASVQTGVTTASSDRFHAIALYAAESGGAAAMNYLRSTVSSSARFGALVSPANQTPQAPSAIPGNGIRPGADGNLFSADLQAWYEIQLLNNREDPGYVAGTDDDAKIVIRAVGHGPGGAIASLEWEVQASGMSAVGRPCLGYGQKGLSEDGAGRNDCMGVIDLADTATYRPGESP